MRGPAPAPPAPGAPGSGERLAAPGAPPPAGTIPLSVPEMRGNEWAYVKECLDTNWVSSVGAFVDRFERAVADAVGARHAVATVNGTAALHVSLLLAGVEPDDEVLTSTLTFIAPANAIRYVGAWPVFVDAEPEHWQMNVGDVARFLERGCRREAGGGVLRNIATGRRVRAIVPVHVLGHPVDVAPLVELARRHELVVIEDATESLGASYRGERVGRFGATACFSFNGNKLITTGGGGMLVTNDDDLARRARHLTTQAKADPIEYVHDVVGYNYRLTNVLAAIGVAQMEHLDEYVEAKRRIAARYAEGLADVPGLGLMREAPWARSAFWMYTVLVSERELGMSSRELLRALAARRVQCRPLWQPLHLSPAHRGARCATEGGCPVAERLNREALSLPCSVGLGEEDQAWVIEQIRALAARGGGGR
ncbi:MAG TPA: LegC family aminotransferase [Gemmatimonadaceae bacterium]